ncbi:Peptidoglycan DL-endopeptidase CwlO [Lentibacillus sp. JNUCC-1]|uniref:C40 family peptidase n=1 Tax=Lentibacillus sp. JNUCC-1 TaxID=2654513 RepID=UPI0012E74DB4|nr:C40 family peptidase [Lentibacillus sp. JNUCC-1]MUV39139.1 Peptidoglycan DL-endopeptidase CwlO [Lentibacillus sp. JNUCC-1]
MRKSILTVSAVAAIGFSSVFTGNVVHADSLQSLKQQKAGVQDERASIKSELSDAEAKIADVLTDIEKINQEIERTEEALKANQDKLKETKTNIDETNKKITQLEDEIKELEASIEKRMEILQKRARSYQENGGDISYMDVVFGAKSFGDFISRLAIVNKITESDAALVEEQESDKKAVVEKQGKVEDRLQELEDMKFDLEEMESVIVAQQETNAEKKQDLNKKKTNLRKMAAKLEVKDSRLASLETSIGQSIAAANRPSPGSLTTLGSSDSSNSSSNNTSSNNSISKPAANTAVNTTPAPSGSGGVSSAISLGKQYIGRSTYVYGAKNPSRGQFDCSGFVSWALESSGYGTVPRSTRGLRNFGTRVPASQMQAGDLVFFNTTSNADSHVGIYLGGGKFLGSQSSTGVGIANMNSGYWKSKFKGHVRRIQ